MNVSLPHQTRRINFEAARDGDGSAWFRASEAEVRDVAKRDRTGGFEVSIDDGDEHDVVLVEDVDGMLGYCDCDGFAYHGTADRLAGNACAHLCLVRQMAVLDDSLIPSTTTRFDVDGEPTEDDGTETIDADVVDDPEADEDESAEITVEDDPSDDASPTVKTPETTVDNPFADELEDVDARFVMDLGGEPYIRRRGFQRLARSEGFDVVTEMVTYQSDTDNELAEARARVLKDGDVVATGTGTAHLPSEDMDGAAGNLNELAETRALSRAMGWATGAGLSAVEVDAAAEYDGDDVEHVATDGGQR
jgi:hypothetical protein